MNTPICQRSEGVNDATFVPHISHYSPVGARLRQAELQLAEQFGRRLVEILICAAASMALAAVFLAQFQL